MTQMRFLICFLQRQRGLEGSFLHVTVFGSWNGTPSRFENDVMIVNIVSALSRPHTSCYG